RLLLIASVNSRAGRHVLARRNPLVIGLELHFEHVIENPEITVAPAHHGARHDVLHLLRDHTHIRLVAAFVGEAVEAEAIRRAPKPPVVVLERDTGSPPPAAAAATAEASATAAAHSHAAASNARPGAAPDARAARRLHTARTCAVRRSVCRGVSLSRTVCRG